MSLNNSTPLTANSWWSSSIIDFQTNDFKDYRTIRVNVFSDVSATLHLFASNDIGQSLQEVGVLSIVGNVGGSLMMRPTMSLFQAKVQNGAVNATITNIQIDLIKDEIVKPLCDNNGIPISSLNPLNVQMNGLTDLNVNMHDKDGNGIVSANGALATYFTNGTISSYTRDGYGNQITSTVEATGHSMNTHLTNDNIAVRLFDGNNTVLTSQNNCLNTNVVNNPSVSISNTPNVNIAGGTVYAAIQNPYITTRLNDGQGNMLLSAGNKLLTICTNTVSIADSAGNAIGSYNGALNVNQEHLIAGSDFVSAFLRDASGNSVQSSNGSLNVHTTNPFTVSRLQDTAGTPIYSTNGGIRTADYINDLINGVYSGSGFGESLFLKKLICYRSQVSMSGSDITTNNTDRYPWSVFPVQGLQVYCVSTSANDTASGTGAQQLTIQGLDNTGAPLSAVFTMNGTSNSTTASPYFSRINSAFVSQAGSDGTNDGSISIMSNDGTTLIMNVVSGVGVSQNGQLSLSLAQGFNAILRRCDVQASPSYPVNLYFKVRRGGVGVWTTLDTCYAVGATSKDLCILLNAGDDFNVYGVSTASQGAVSVQIEYVLGN